MSALSTDIIVKVGKNLHHIPSILSLSFVSKQIRCAMLTGMEWITRDYCEQDPYLQKLLVAEHVFPWKRLQWIYYVECMERKRGFVTGLPSQLNTIDLESMENVDVICESTLDDTPVCLYVGLPAWKTTLRSSVTIACYGKTECSIPKIPIQALKPTNIRMYLVVSGKMHHWATSSYYEQDNKREYDGYYDGKSVEQDAEQDDEQGDEQDDEQDLQETERTWTTCHPALSFTTGEKLKIVVNEKWEQGASNIRFHLGFMDILVTPILESGYWKASLSIWILPLNSAITSTHWTIN